MTPPDDDSLLPAINSKLQSLAGPEHLWPAWYRQWLELGPESSDAERVAACQAIWDSRELPEDAGFSLVVWQINEIADRLAETGLQHLTDHLEKIEADYEKLHGHLWREDEEPAEWTEVFQEYDDACSEIFVQCLDTLGVNEVADYYQHGFDVFNRRYERGLKYFEPPQDAPRRKSTKRLVEVAAYATSVQADVVRIAIEQAGIYVSMESQCVETEYWPLLAYGGQVVKLSVYANDEDKALRIIRDVRTFMDGTMQDCPEFEEPGQECPECGERGPSRWDTCWNCGHVLSASDKFTEPEMPATEKESSESVAIEAPPDAPQEREAGSERVTQPNKQYIPIFEGAVLVGLLGVFMHNPIVGAFAIPVVVFLIVLYRGAMNSEVDES